MRLIRTTTGNLYDLAVASSTNSMSKPPPTLTCLAYPLFNPALHFYKRLTRSETGGCSCKNFHLRFHEEREIKGRHATTQVRV
jgi:hypothetical protein